MKQFLFLLMSTLAGGLGTLYHPFWGLLLYYMFAVLRPQWLWAWALPMDVRWSMGAAAIVIGGVMLNFNKLVFHRTHKGVMWLIIAYGIVLLISVIFAKFPDIAMNWGIEYAKVLFIAVISSLLISRLWQIEAMSLMIVVCLGYLAWHINSLYLFEGRLDVYHIGFGGLDNNGAGLMIAMGLPFAHAFAINSKCPWQKALAAFAGLLIIHAVMMTYSRGAMLAGACGLLWLLIHHRNRRQAATIAVIAFAAILVLAGPEIRDRFMSTTEYHRDGSAQMRFDSWRAGIRLALAHPLTGVGIRNSHLLLVNFGEGELQGRTIHSQFIQIAADSGLIAAGLYACLIALTIRNFRRVRGMIDRFNESHGEEIHDHQCARLAKTRGLALSGETAIVIFTIGSVFLSMETFELPWLLIVIAGTMPYSIERYLDGIAPAQASTAEPAAGPRLVPPAPDTPAPEPPADDRVPLPKAPGPAAPWTGPVKGVLTT